MKSPLACSIVRWEEGHTAVPEEQEEREGRVLLLPSGKPRRGWRMMSTQGLGKRGTGPTKEGWTQEGGRLGREAKESDDDLGAMGGDPSGN